MRAIPSPSIILKSVKAKTEFEKLKASRTFLAGFSYFCAVPQICIEVVDLNYQ